MKLFGGHLEIILEINKNKDSQKFKKNIKN